jgi:glycosyltransferase involved in cell wall biosynthesis
MTSACIHIINPSVPDYRVNFYIRLKVLLEASNVQLKIYSAEEDDLGVKTSASASVLDIRPIRIVKPIKGLLWYSNLIYLYGKKDMVVVEGNARVINNLILLLLSKFFGFKMIWWGHGWSAGSNHRNFLTRKFLMNFFDLIILYTDKEVERFLALGFKKPISALNNGINISAVDYNSAHTRLKYSQQQKYCLFIGRATRKSGLDILVRSITNINSEVKFIVIGDGEFLDEYKRLAISLTVNDRIEWVGELYNENSIASLISKAHVFVYPGSVGLSLIHAFSYGLPAIVHNDEKMHMPEYAAYQENYNGLSFIRNSNESLAEVINYFFDSNKGLELSKNARSTVETNFNTEQMAYRFVNSIKHLIK